MEDLRIEGHIWLETPKGLKIGRGRALLLEFIEKTGSIAAAARSTNISYRKAWGMVQEMNQFAPLPLVIKNVGGREGGGTFLTKEGKSLLVKFRKINQEFNQFKDKNAN
ncbi:LysR family transcriptional regulator [Apibacter muscae]|uniref:winged helix-turn-helix domain-containing protein n=1 Tax=Apibacter muscae TaxID=2509004 RepID=UPI0011AC91AC|nr:LysR family transcriptional regulator [Apibacter muscae]TWP23773.1 LysR family transcriptional regulator [Apibacter muscae]